MSNRYCELSFYQLIKIVLLLDFSTIIYYLGFNNYCSRDSYEYMSAGDPDYGADSIYMDKVLPDLSPTANLAGIWKGNGR
jgi:hypothetical protein